MLFRSEFNNVMNYDLKELDKMKQPLLFSKIDGDILLHPSLLIKKSNESNDEQFYHSNDLLSISLKSHMLKYDTFINPGTNDLLKHYDVVCGQKFQTSLKYMFYSRFFIIPVEEPISIKLTSPSNSKYLYPNENFENLKFESEYNPWTTNIPTSNVPFLDITVHPGQYLYIPSYWWYSIKFMKKTNILLIKYDTLTSIVANSNYYFLGFYSKLKKYIEYTS